MVRTLYVVPTLCPLAFRIALLIALFHDIKNYSAGGGFHEVCMNGGKRG